MIVVADASPLNYLIQLQCDEVLPRLYRRVYAPLAVIEELRHPAAPGGVVSWLAHIPEWIEIRTVASAPDLSLEALGPGEQQAIQLAQEQHADLLLIDERKGRLEATRRGITTTGTLGVLLAAGVRGLLDAESAYRRLLRETNFRATPQVEERFMKLLRGERKP